MMNRFNKFLKKKKSDKNVQGSPKNASVIKARSTDRRLSRSLFAISVCLLFGMGSFELQDLPLRFKQVFLVQASSDLNQIIFC